MKFLNAFAILIFSALVTDSYSQDTAALAAKIKILRNETISRKDLIKTEKLIWLVDEKNHKELFTLWKFTDSITGKLVSATKWHTTISKKEKRDIIETIYYVENNPEYFTIFDELKFSNGERLVRYGDYQLEDGAIITKAENNLLLNLTKILETIQQLNF